MYSLTLSVSFMFTIYYLTLAQVDRRTGHDAYVEKDLVRGRNVMENVMEPMYTLNFTEVPDENDHVHQRKYKVRVTSTYPLKVINAVKIITESSPDCGEGQFTFDRNDFYQSQDTERLRVLASRNRQMLAESPNLLWSPPFCGCVSFRVLVVEGKHYYKDNETVENGPLSRVVCVEKLYDRYSYLRALCAATKSNTAIKVVGRPYFLNRHNIDSMKEDSVKLIEALQTRWTQNEICCSKHIEKDILKCIDEFRRQRIDSLCTYNRTDIPLVNYKAKHTLIIKDQCCNRQGKIKYLCFASNSRIDYITVDTLLDFSKEDTDPINDLAIFGSVEDVDVWRHVTLVEIRNKTTRLDIYNENSDEIAKLNNGTWETKELRDTNLLKKIKNRCCVRGTHSGRSLTTRLTKNAEGRCKGAAKTYASSQTYLKSNAGLCKDSFAACCMESWCCSMGKKFGSTKIIPSNEPRVVLGECQKDFEAYVKLQDLTVDYRSNVLSYEMKFVGCCVEKVSAVNIRKGMKYIYGTREINF